MLRGQHQPPGNVRWKYGRYSRSVQTDPASLCRCRDEHRRDNVRCKMRPAFAQRAN
jgi:hypothetical protein